MKYPNANKLLTYTVKIEVVDTDFKRIKNYIVTLKSGSKLIHRFKNLRYKEMFYLHRDEHNLSIEHPKYKDQRVLFNVSEPIVIQMVLTKK